MNLAHVFMGIYLEKRRFLKEGISFGVYILAH